MKNAILDKLVASNTIKSYNYETDEPFDNHNQQQLTIVFNDGHKLVLDSFCSGCLENSGFFIDENTDMVEMKY